MSARNTARCCNLMLAAAAVAMGSAAASEATPTDAVHLCAVVLCSAGAEGCANTVSGHFEHFTETVLKCETPVSPLVSTALSQWLSHEGFRSNLSGDIKHFEVDSIGNLSGKFISSFALPVVFHQDEQYHPCQPHSPFSRRFWHVTEHLFRLSSSDCSNDSGTFNASAIPGVLLSAGISNLYEPASDRTFWATMGRAGWGAVGFFVSDSLDEADVKGRIVRLARRLGLRGL